MSPMLVSRLYLKLLKSLNVFIQIHTNKEMMAWGFVWAKEERCRSSGKCVCVCVCVSVCACACVCVRVRARAHTFPSYEGVQLYSNYVDML